MLQKAVMCSSGSLWFKCIHVTFWAIDAVSVTSCHLCSYYHTWSVYTNLYMSVCVCMQVKLVQHTYSCLFGTFLCNSGKEREDRHVQERTCSVWSLLRPANRTLRNMLYSTHSETVGLLSITVSVLSLKFFRKWILLVLVWRQRMKSS